MKNQQLKLDWSESLQVNAALFHINEEFSELPCNVTEFIYIHVYLFQFTNWTLKLINIKMIHTRRVNNRVQLFASNSKTVRTKSSCVMFCYRRFYDVDQQINENKINLLFRMNKYRIPSTSVTSDNLFCFCFERRFFE